MVTTFWLEQFSWADHWHALRCKTWWPHSDWSSFHGLITDMLQDARHGDHILTGAVFYGLISYLTIFYVQIGARLLGYMECETWWPYLTVEFICPLCADLGEINELQNARHGERWCGGAPHGLETRDGPGPCAIAMASHTDRIAQGHGQCRSHRLCEKLGYRGCVHVSIQQAS